jgi:hypothetical protein
MNLFARLILSAGLVAGMAVPAMAQTTSHVVKHRAPIAHHVAKASPVAATPAPAAAKPVAPVKN